MMPRKFLFASRSFVLVRSLIAIDEAQIDHEQEHEHDYETGGGSGGMAVIPACPGGNGSAPANAQVNLESNRANVTEDHLT